MGGFWPPIGSISSSVAPGKDRRGIKVPEYRYGSRAIWWGRGTTHRLQDSVALRNARAQSPPYPQDEIGPGITPHACDFW